MNGTEQLTFPEGEALPGPPAQVAAKPSPGSSTPSRVARVVLDVPLAHLDRPFDYAVPEELDTVAVPGARVSVRFAGRETAGFIVERADSSEHTGRLAPLRRVVSPVPVLTPEVHALARAVADHYAGTLSDVLRLAVPPRHARAEGAALAAPAEAAEPERPEPDPGVSERAEPGAAPRAEQRHDLWGRYDGGAAFVRRLASGESPRAVWTALPDGGSGRGGDHRAAIAAAVGATLAGGRGAVVVVPESREVARVSEALGRAGIAHERLVAEDGASTRYRAFMRLLLGRVRVAVGTRAAAFAPVEALGLVVVWDDGDDLLAEPRAPYPHALTVLRLRADLARAGALVGGYARSSAAQQLLASGWARAVQAPRPAVRAATPRVIAPDEADLAREGAGGRARIPHVAWEAARAGLQSGPVLVQVPRAGYVPVTGCARCRAPARCGQCHGPLRLDRPDGPPTCAWCGRPDAAWECPECDGRTLRAGRVGSARTAEELGRAFPQVPVLVSSATAPGGVVENVDGRPRLVVATPGAEPEAEEGYAAALILDAAITTGRPELWASEEALRRWLGAAALVRPAPAGGRVVVLGEGAVVPTQALVRWDPGGFAERELGERQELGFPPAAATAAIQGAAAAVESYLRHLRSALGDVAAGLEPEVLGPVPVPDARPGDEQGPPVRAIVRTDRRHGRSLSRALAHAAAARSVRKEPGGVRIQVDPADLW